MSCDQTGPKTAGDCTRGSHGRRNRYFRDKQLTVEDYRAEQAYSIERRRLVNRTMLGWGVVAGFEISQDRDGLTVGRGVALDRRGREVVACKSVLLAEAGDLVWLVRNEKCGWEAGEPPKPGEVGECPLYLLSAHYAECPVDGVRVGDDCGGARCEANYICETVVYSLRPVDGCPPECPPGLESCLDQLWHERQRPCCEKNEEQQQQQQQQGPNGAEQDLFVAPVDDRGTQRRLVDWSLDRHCDADFCTSRKLDPVDDLWTDLDGGVPLACVKLDFHCDEAFISEVCDDWTPRRLARPNDALFDLVRGCDLVRIVDVGWRDWLPSDEREIPFSRFAKMFVRPKRLANAPKGRKGSGWAPADTQFHVRFSGPVQVASLTPDIFTIALVQKDDNEAVGEVRRAPVVKIEPDARTEGDPPGTTRGFRPLVSARFWNGEINPDSDSGFDSETIVELCVRTPFILDPHGQEVAGGGRFLPTTQGGPFLSTLTVIPDEAWSRRGASRNARNEVQEISDDA